MILRPDEYGHQNSNNAFVDSLNVRGGRRVVADLSELYLLYNLQDKLKDNITTVRVLSEDIDYILTDKTKANLPDGWKVNTSKDEIYIGSTEPIDLNIKLWGKPKSSDLDILKQIRSANPGSDLNTIWNDATNPNTDWGGVFFGNTPGLDAFAATYGIQLPPLPERLSNKVYGLNVGYDLLFINLDNVNKLDKLIFLYASNSSLSNIDVSNLINLKHLVVKANKLTTANLTNTNNLTKLYLFINLLTNISTLTSKGLITDFDFTLNNLPINETNRLISLGFDSQSVLPQN